MKRLIQAYDKVSALETPLEGGLHGRVIFGTGRHKIHYTDPFGHESVRTEFENVLYESDNIVPIGGYQFAFDKLFNIGLDQETTLRVGDLNDESPQMNIGVPRSKYRSIYYNGETHIGAQPNIPLNSGINISANNFVFGFMVGDGGAREDNVTPIAPNYKDRSLFHAIPFRMSNDGYAFPEGKYFGKQAAQGAGGSEPIISYYVKLFDEPSVHIVHVWANHSAKKATSGLYEEKLDIVDDTVFSSTSSTPIETYAEINFSVSNMDCRGYFTTTDTTPRINEFALVSGWYNPIENDYECLRLFTKYSRPSISLIEGDAIEGIYRLYAR